MTLKFCSYRLKVGGAKAGIWGNPNDVERKNILLTSFANSINTYIKNDAYYPGPDMGTDDNDLLKIFKVIGAPNLAPKKLGLKKQNIPVEELFTGYGVIYCLETIYNNIEKLGRTKYINNNKPKIILEGFGKVGSGIAMSLKELGFILTGISTIKGAIFDEDGLNIEELLKLKINHGDDLVNQYESKNLVKIPKEKLFGLSSEYQTDFIIPGARPDVINRKNIDKIEAIGIIPAANIPYEAGVIELLEEKNVLVFPDFVANAGEVLAILVSKLAKDADEIFEYIRAKITEKTFGVLQGAKDNSSSVYNYAVEDALRELKKKQKRKKNLIEKLNKRY